MTPMRHLRLTGVIFHVFLLLFLQFLLFPQHGHLLLSKGAFATLADVEPFVPVMEFVYGEMQVADTTARGIWLTGNLAVTLE